MISKAVTSTQTCARLGSFRCGSMPQRRKREKSMVLPGSSFGDHPFGPKLSFLWVVLVILFLWTSPVEARGSFTTDCSANHRLQCRVEKGTCANNSRSDDYPAAPFDLRVSWFMVATTPGKLDTFQLWVNVSWKPTYERSINKTDGFELTVLDKDTNRRHCFTFNLDQPQWENNDRHTSIRFQFSTVDIFEFGHNYYIEVYSLPKPSIGITPKRETFIGRETTMPLHPEQFLLEQLNRTGYFESSTSQLEAMTAHCVPSPETKHVHGSGAHPQASKWVAAFRYVYIQPKAKFIFVDFVAAPPQYCFEEYELRLLKNIHEIVEVTKIRREDLTHEIYGNVSVAFGNYTFHNVTPGVYEIGVIPLDHSLKDSRCLCPAFGRTCTCAQAIWPDVLMPEPPKSPDPPANPCDLLPPVKLPFDCPMELNTTKPTVIHGKDGDFNVTKGAAALACLLVGALFLVVAGALLLHFYCKRHKAKVAARMYLWPPTSSTDFDLGRGGDGLSGTEMTPILRTVKVLIIYSRDCPAHEAAVKALGEYLRSNCMCDVAMDSLCAKEINANKYDWAYKSILEADRVLLVNSYGAFMRYQAKLKADANHVEKTNGHIHNTSTIIERVDPSPTDDLFLLQLDMITQFHQQDPNIGSKFISIRFGYTPAQNTLPHANPYIRYEIPRHFRKLAIDLHQLHSVAIDTDDESFASSSSIPPRLRDVNAKDYARSVEGQQLKKCIAAMDRYAEEYPDWFERLHVRRPAVVAVPSVPKTLSDKKPSSPWRTNGYVTAVPLALALEERLESQFPPCTSVTAGSSPPTKPPSTADSGFDEPVATTSSICVHESADGESTEHECMHNYRIPFTDDGLGIDPSECLLENDEQFGPSSVNMDSCDSGIASDYLHSTSSTTGSTCNGSAYEYFSPKTVLRSHGLNGVARSPAKAKKIMDPAAVEAQRLIC